MNMKKLMLSFLMIGLLASCSNNSKTSSSPDTTTAKEEAKPTDPDVEKGLTLVSSNDCFGCHQVATKINGPAYRDVATKYKDSPSYIVDTLVQRVLRGSTGHWGTVQMTPHPSLSQDDAKAMVKYVLSLKQ
jgi:cytochrome c